MSAGKIGSVRITSNGCKVAERVPRKSIGFRVPSTYIAAIDFGTTSCSVAYVIQNEEVQRLSLNDTFYRVPTAILFEPDGKVFSFGIEAQQDYRNLDDDKRPNYIYFEHFKMKLQNDEVRLMSRSAWLFLDVSSVVYTLILLRASIYYILLLVT